MPITILVFLISSTAPLRRRACSNLLWKSSLKSRMRCGTALQTAILIQCFPGIEQAANTRKTAVSSVRQLANKRCAKRATHIANSTPMNFPYGLRKIMGVLCYQRERNFTYPPTPFAFVSFHRKPAIHPSIYTQRMIFEKSFVLCYHILMILKINANG